MVPLGALGRWLTGFRASRHYSALCSRSLESLELDAWCSLRPPPGAPAADVQAFDRLNRDGALDNDATMALVTMALAAPPALRSLSLHLPMALSVHLDRWAAASHSSVARGSTRATVPPVQLGSARPCWVLPSVQNSAKQDASAADAAPQLPKKRGR